ncbi:MAG: ATP synthase F1 subunit delta [Alphaproteobacteria bacterium]
MSAQEFNSTRSSSVAARYALALLGHVGEAAGEIAATEESLIQLKNILKAEPKIIAVLASPQASKDEQQAVINHLAASLNTPTQKLLRLLAQNRRADILPQVVDAALAEIARGRGEVVAHVRVARPLPKEEQKRLAEILTHAIGSKPILHIEHDPSLLAGLVVRLGSQMFDGSLKGKLDRLSLSFADLS